MLTGPPNTRPETPQDRSLRESLYRLSGIGLEFVGAVVGFGAIGWGIDHLTGRAVGGPFTIGGIVLGLIGASIKFVRSAMLANKEFANTRYPNARPADPEPGTAEPGDGPPD